MLLSYVEGRSRVTVIRDLYRNQPAPAGSNYGAACHAQSPRLQFMRFGVWPLAWLHPFSTGGVNL